jgi:hypothetical protein
MASEAILKELFTVSKNSKFFKGMSDRDIWDACLAYKDRPDTNIRIAMHNIRDKDAKITEESEKKKKIIEKNGESLNILRKKEETDRGADARMADKILEDFFQI